jgi:hypothetical protein
MLAAGSFAIAGTVAREWIDIARERIEMIFLRSPQLTARKA